MDSSSGIVVTKSSPRGHTGANKEFNQEKGATERQKSVKLIASSLGSGSLLDTGEGIFHQNVAKQNKLQSCFAPWEAGQCCVDRSRRSRWRFGGQVGAAGIWKSANNCAGT